MSRCFGIFDILENPEHESFFRSFIPRKFEEQQIVCDCNTTENSVFVVLSGELRVYVSYEGREFTLFFLGPGEVFTTHSKMIVVAKKPSEILVTSLKTFEEALVAIPALSVSIIVSLGRGLGSAVRVIEGLAFRDVKHRLIYFLLEIAKERGHKVDDGIAVTMDYSLEDVATLIGSTRPSTSMMFNELVRDGHVARINRKLIIIRDLKRLQRLTETSTDEPAMTWMPDHGDKAATTARPRKMTVPS
ncbi:MAG: Crp/Fnr family transcriptional regulator [Azospirillaceae bacterium]|nr:Crp/Fnr family transcriptional regulator [Azospirillaceae bacterium]